MKRLVLFSLCLLIFEGSFAQDVPGMLSPTSVKGSDPDPTPLNGSNTLGMTYNQSDCGLNYVQDSKLIQTRSATYGFNTNGTGMPTTFNIAGIPGCATILRAYFWYTVSYTSPTPPATNAVINSVSVPATNIGTSGTKAWAETGTVVYRADVTANVTGNGAYNMDVTGLTNKNYEIDGATLMVIYKDNGATYRGSLVLWDGCWSICAAFPPAFNTLNQTMSGINACGASTAGNAFLIVSDNQANITPPQHISTLNGAPTTFPNDFYNFDVANTAVTAAQNTAAYGMQGAPADCFCWSLMGLYYQTTSCTTCVPAAVSLTVTPTQASCGTPGSATAAASGAPAPYTYSWSTGATTTSISNLAAGTYSVSVTDATGCSTSQTFSISPSGGPAFTYTATPVLCNGGSTGSVALNVTGGTAPYTYGWATTPLQSGPTATGLAAGTYSVLVADANGCSQTSTITITQPTAVTLSVTVVNTSCSLPTGSASVSASGGTGSHTYSWSNGDTNASVSNLAAGTYSISVSDANGCSVVQTFSISPFGILTATASVVGNVSCNGSSDGSATVTASGGTGAYTYAWTPSAQNSQTATGLAAGNYSLLVTDANGCTVPQTVTITEPAPIATPTSSVAATCGVADGSATVSPSGGTVPYTYLWLTSPVQTTQTANNLISGTYTVIVTDMNGCLMSQSVVVPGSSPPVADFFFSPTEISMDDPLVNFTDASSGVVTSWYWTFGDFSAGGSDTSALQNPSYSYPDTGTYCITLRISNGSAVCSDTVTKCLKVEADFTFYIPNTFTPNHDGKNEIFYGYGTYIKEFYMMIFDRWGNLIFESNDLYKGWDGSVNNNGDIVQEDVYVWKVRLIDVKGAEHRYIGHVNIVK